MKRKILVAFLPLCLVPLAIGAVFSYLFAQSVLTRQVFSHIRSIGAVEKNRIENFVDNNLQHVSLIATRGHLRGSLERFLQTRGAPERDRLNRILSEISDAMPQTNEVSILSLNGTVLASSNRKLVRTKHPNTAPLMAAQYDNRFDIFFPDEKSNEPRAFLYGPIHREGRLLGIIAAETDFDRFTAWVAERPPVGETVETQLARWDASGNALFLTPETTASHRSMRRAAPPDPESARQLMAGRRFLPDVLDSRGHRVIATTYYLPKMDWNLVVKIDRSEALSAVDKLRNLFLILFLILAAAIVAISSLVARSLILPVDSLRRTAERVRDGDLTAKATVGSKDEIGTLAQVLNQMTSGLIQAKSSLERMVEERTGELARSETRLRTSNTFLDSIIENIPNMIFVKDAKDLRFIRFNRAGEELLGQPREVLIGKTDYDFFPKAEADHFTAFDRKVLEAGKIMTIDQEPIHTKDGIRQLRTRKIPILDAQKKPLYLLGISEDITERIHAEQNQIDLARARAEKEQLELFAYIAAHDLQEPLHKIVSFGDLLREQIPGEGKTADYVERMQAGAKRMSRLIEDLLRFSRVTTKEEALEPLDLGALIHDITLDLEFRIHQTNARIEIGEMPTIRASRVQMREVFQNLIANALKFRKKDEPPHIKIMCDSSSEKEYVITVSDNGIGFENKFQDRIFRPFERLHGRKDYEGSGIGLAICQKMIARHGGRITANGVPGQGAVFTITLSKDIVEQRDTEKNADANKSSPDRL